MCACVVIHQLSTNAHQFDAEDAINWAQDFYRGRRPCSSIERKYFGQLHVEVPFKVSLKVGYEMPLQRRSFSSSSAIKMLFPHARLLYE